MSFDLPARARELRASVAWHDIVLAGILCIAAFMRLYQLDDNGYGNIFYAAGVKSMLTGWHNFFYLSFDSGGFVSIDKPPLTFWAQAASAKALGFSGTSIILPQVMAGVASVGFLYYIVQRAFSVPAALIASFALAVSPINVAVDRGTNVESMLVLTSLGAAACALQATRTGDLRWSLATGLVLGLAFEVKMLESIIIVPALAAAFYLGSELAVRERLRHLFLAAGVLAVVGLAWAVAVDVTPADKRPYMGGSGSNSALDLVFGFNGVGRITGGANNTFSRYPGAPRFNPTSFDGGEAGPFRLVDGRLGGQAAWLLPIGLLGVAAAWRGGVRERLDEQRQQLVLWSGWFALLFLIFSSAQGIFHGYYVAFMAPAVCALAGIGLVAMWERYREGLASASPGWRAWLLPVAVFATGALQVSILDEFRHWNGWLWPLAGLGALMLALALAAMLARRATPRLALGALALATVVLFAAPIAWAVTPLVGPLHGVLPSAGPQPDPASRLSETGISYGPPELLRFLQANRGGAKFLVATPNSASAAPLMLETGEPVMSTSGFIGNVRVLTPRRLAERVFNNDVRYLIVTPEAYQPELLDWLTDNCDVLAPGVIGPSGDEVPEIAPDVLLFDCGLGNS